MYVCVCVYLITYKYIYIYIYPTQTINLDIEISKLQVPLSPSTIFVSDIAVQSLVDKNLLQKSTMLMYNKEHTVSDTCHKGYEITGVQIQSSHEDRHLTSTMLFLCQETFASYATKAGVFNLRHQKYT